MEGEAEPRSPESAHGLGDELSASGRGGQARAARSAGTQASLSRVHSGGQRTGAAEQRVSVERPRAEGSAGEGTLQEKGTPRCVGRPARKCSGIESLRKAAEACRRGAERCTGPPGGGRLSPLPALTAPLFLSQSRRHLPWLVPPPP